MEFITEHWEVILFGIFYAAEKIVKLTPSEKDDLLFDSLLIPIFDYVKRVVGK